MVGRLDRAIRPAKRSVRGTPGIGASTAAARDARPVTVPSDSHELVVVRQDAHGNGIGHSAVVEYAVERDHSETSTSKRSLTSEPVAVPAAPGCRGERLERVGRFDAQASARGSVPSGSSPTARRDRAVASTTTMLLV